MKTIIFICTVLFFSLEEVKAQQYQYYFIELRPTSKAEVELTPEMGVKYTDIDTLIVSKREPGKKGGEIVTGKKYDSYSDAFNALSSHGLEFVQLAALPTFGGGASLLVGDVRMNYMIWRRKLQ